MMPQKYREKGFTIMELMIAVAIAGVLVSLAMPTFRDSIKRNRVAMAQDELFSALIFARSEAVNRSLPVSLCVSANQTSCSGGAGVVDWSSGWIVFEDANANGTLDAGEQALRVRSALTGATLSWSSGGSLVYNNQGFTSVTGTFTLCDDDASLVYAKSVTVTNTGRVRRSEKTVNGGALAC
ncbi:GspH/FimT family pseudopilin [Aestuariirhabdus litorea]|uniref:Type II secretion system protein H n=1 Tax=Aestuariirhabdus litorea TaxID=2528527 RepID=A0A3P3VKM3_9GAMM|nr:GspH/FimT family pseudopilin [Aestuariirhabdus litorea]RRJ82286.1 prepilin-type N-terminal cleavage/methylation domain-containing protein [Aestuariirhabdus litorea]RWW92452.1 prepilin-type N-terminal cleavage/methylation domain-containing protein [Endozoicomonadaceae bacterium GTF-13]